MALIRIVTAVLAVALLSNSVPPAVARQTRGRNPNPRPPKRMTGVQIEWAAFDLINQERRKTGLKALKWDPDLLIVSRLHSEKMSREGSVSHSAGGTSLTDRLRKGGFPSWAAAGENLAQNRGYSNPAKAAVENWLKSDDHRKIMLDPRWEVTAVGVAIDRTGQVYLTQDFIALQR